VYAQNLQPTLLASRRISVNNMDERPRSCAQEELSIDVILQLPSERERCLV
jgi:hypothetical protein